jgi:hypothetical protein
MPDDELEGGDLPDDESGMLGIVVQGTRVDPSSPFLDFGWGPPLAQAAPSLPFGIWKPAVRAA